MLKSADLFSGIMLESAPMEQSSNPIKEGSGNLIQLLKSLFNLKADTDKALTIDLIKSNVEFRSANAWTLVFAILIASVGLNVNSTAVIIGAMLISPLMGPIIGVGLALGTYDIELLKKSGKNLAAAVLISVLASTIYFLISPLSEVQSELLARTRPSFFDVLIAFFSGCAGIIAISRKNKSHANAGMAIATALMPPLCTAGFGLATTNFSYFFGAMYLFVINCVFISISTFIFVRYLNFHKDTVIEVSRQKKIHQWITYIVTAVIIPSFFMAWYLQRESYFKSQASKFISRELRTEKSIVLEQEIKYSFKSPQIKVTLLGESLSDTDLLNLKTKAKLYSIDPDSVVIRQSTFSESLEKKIEQKISTAEILSSELEKKLKKTEAELFSFKSLQALSTEVSRELSIFFPNGVDVLITKDSSESASSEPLTTQNESSFLKVIVKWKSTPVDLQLAQSSEFLAKRLSISQSSIVHLKYF